MSNQNWKMSYSVMLQIIKIVIWNYWSQSWHAKIQEVNWIMSMITLALATVLIMEPIKLIRLHLKIVHGLHVRHPWGTTTCIFDLVLKKPTDILCNPEFHKLYFISSFTNLRCMNSCLLSDISIMTFDSVGIHNQCYTLISYETIRVGCTIIVVNTI